jgi:hypothetical protein
MTRVMLPSLPARDRRLLSIVGRLVPPAGREEWLRAWQAELWHVHYGVRRTRAQQVALMTDVAIGLTRDALWLRTESWRCMLDGTALLCLGSLIALSVVCVVFALAFTGGRQALADALKAPFLRCLASFPLVLFVALATASRRHIEQTTVSPLVYRLKRAFFFAVKISQVFLLAFLLSVAACYPLHLLLPHTADLYQMFGFVLLSLCGMRWALRDQEQRCKQCLQLLAAPARVGRPSHNLLEWNGTELSCKQGHGLLSVPEMETSWCQSSHWTDQRVQWDEVVSA